jgi:signal peptidase I
MEPNAPVATAPPPGVPTHHRWVGVLLSLLIPAAGIFLAGNRKAGLRWFLGLTVLWVVLVALAPVPVIPGLAAFAVLAGCLAVLTPWMLVLSYKPVSKLGIRGWLLFLVLAGLLRGFKAPVVHQFALVFKVPHGSMEPTIQPGDQLLAQTSAYWFGAPHRGDIVVFRTDALDASMVPKGQYFAKRVAGLPGDKVRITGGRLFINDSPLESRAVLAGSNFSMPFVNYPAGDTNVYVVPEGQYFTVGDNATNSLDSRHFGAIPRRSIIGRATKIYWPLVRAGDIR